MGEIDLLARGRPVRLPWDRSWTLTLRQHAPLFHIKDLHRAFQNRAHQPSCQAVLTLGTPVQVSGGCVAGSSVLRHKGTGPREVTLRLGLGTSPHLEADTGMGRADPARHRSRRWTRRSRVRRRLNIDSTTTCTTCTNTNTKY